MIRGFASSTAFSCQFVAVPGPLDRFELVRVTDLEMYRDFKLVAVVCRQLKLCSISLRDEDIDHLLAVSDSGSESTCRRRYHVSVAIPAQLTKTQSLLPWLVVQLHSSTSATCGLPSILILYCLVLLSN